jgi:CRISPR/Cas system-associated endonuclease/helicase Cas3
LKEGLLADNLNDIKSSLLSGMKVLIVCNTVKSAQTIFTELKDSVVGRGSFM